MRGLSLLTPTSDRPAAFALCERWMQRALRQMPRVPVQWIVADDGLQPACCTLGQEHLRLPPAENSGESFRRNLAAALQHVRYDAVAFIEDDDWYAPAYLQRVWTWLVGGAQIVGEARARYYHVRERRYLHCRNSAHASLCQTAIRRELVPWLLAHLKRTETTFVDIDLWRDAAVKCRQLLWPNSQLSVGIKGLPGKAGIGIGHRLDASCRRDVDGRVLRQWVGADAEVYRPFADA